MLPDRVSVVSFGYLHDPPPVADLIIDVRSYLRDPQTDPEMRQLTGLDGPVRIKVLCARGADDLVNGMVTLVGGMIESSELNRPVTVAIGCAGGRHRSVALAVHVAELLIETYNWSVDVVHRDLSKPVVLR